MLRFDGKVAIITGAGGGLGREYALLLASRGASIVVNDLGTTPSGEGHVSAAADSVVHEIVKQGGKAIADYNSVENGETVVKTALKKYGRIDILINNAGILRDKAFKNITEDDWKVIFKVHVDGAFSITKAVWQYMCDQKSGKIIMTASNSAIYGNFGQSNYSAAKSALIGFSKTLALEGAKFNISCNVIVPTAASRLTVGLMPREIFDSTNPRLAAPLAVWLCHELCPETGGVFEACGGWFGKITPARSDGCVLLDANGEVSLETVKENWADIINMVNARHFDSLNADLADIIDQIKLNGNKSKMSNEEWIKSFKERRPRSRNTRFEPMVLEYSAHDAILYALSTGATIEKNVNLLYEGDDSFYIYPMFAVVPTAHVVKQLIDFNIPRVKLDFAKLVHGEQYLEFKKPFPPSGRVTSFCKIVDIMDKGNASVALLDTEIKDAQGNLIAKGQYNLFFREAGGFNGDRESPKEIKCVPVPKNRKPDAVSTEKTTPEQAAFYRCTSGDLNPIHIDKSFAQAAGFKDTILHGLCSLGFAVRQIVDKMFPNQFSRLKAVKVRFTKPVLAGQTLITEMWKGDNLRIHFQTKAKETGQIVMSDGFVDFYTVEEMKFQKTTSPEAPIVKNFTTSLKSEKVFDQLNRTLESDPDIVKQIQAIYQWVITVDGKEQATYTVDLKNGSIYPGLAKDKADVTLTIDDQDMVDLVGGKLNPQKAFMTGKLKLKGNIMLTQKLQKLFQSKANL